MHLGLPRTRAWLWIAVLTLVGFSLIYLPPKIVQVAEQMYRVNPNLAAMYLVFAAVGVVCVLCALIWAIWKLKSQSKRRQEQRRRRTKGPHQMSPDEQLVEFREHLERVEQLIGDPRVPPEVRRRLQEELDRLKRKHTAERLEIVAFGTISSGKSAILNQLAGRPVFQTDVRGGTTTTANRVNWPQDDRVVFVDTPGLGEIDGEARMEIAMREAKAADVVLLVVDGPLREFEYQLLEGLHRMGKRVLVCLNKSDYYTARDLELLKNQIVDQTRSLVDPRNVIAVAVDPAPRVVIRILPDGRQDEELREQPPVLEPLARRLLEIVSQEGTQLLMANLLLQARGMTEAVRADVARTWAEEAARLTDRYAWTAALAAGVSPIPILDVVAAAGLSGKLVVDIAALYQKRIDLDEATKFIKQLATLLASTLGINVITSAALALSALASILKAVPGAGTLAGAALQAVIQLLVVRWVGRVANRHYQHDFLNQPRSLAEIASEEWKQITSLSSLRKLVEEYHTRRNEVSAEEKSV